MMPYRQEDSETNCTHGLISEVDTLVFKTRVELSDDILLRYIYFQRKSNLDSTFLFFKGIVTNGSVADNDSLEITRPNVAQFSIKEKAKTENSGARIRGVIVTSDYQEIFSEQQMYPDIRESTDIQLRLFVNGVEAQIQNNTCDVHAIGTNIVILTECQSPAVPCLIEISSNDLKTPLLGKGYVLHTSELPELNITIKYATCTFHGKFNTINCRIRHDVDLETKTKATKEESNTTTVHILSTMIAILLIFISFIIVYTYFWRRHQFLRESHQSEKQTFKVSCDCKLKTENSFNGNNPSHGHLQPQQSSTILLETHSFIESDEKEERQPFINTTGKVDQQGNDSLLLKKTHICQGEDSCEMMEEEAKKTEDSFSLKNEFTTPSVPDYTTGIGRIVEQTTTKEILQMLKVHVKDV
ncbi:unnamed protein product [Lymnaea stagnalis]|uniref:Uncharacterized protein n=1 Tax=Lymnaea stagnalis TaxID=6523 RepID=A0AAV2IA68_LYMST